MATDIVAPPGEERYWKPIITVAATAVAIAALIGIASIFVDRFPAWVGHGLSHALPLVPLLFLVGVASRHWPPPHAARPGRTGRRVVLAGLWGVCLGQVLEVVGARVDAPGATLVEGVAHVAGQIVTMLSLPLVIVGMIGCLVAGSREGAVPKWGVAVVAVLAAGVFMMMMIGAPDGS